MFGQICERCEQLLRVKRARCRRGIRILLRHYRQSMATVLSIVAYYNGQWIAWLAINLPLNCYLLGSILFSVDFNRHWISLWILFMIQQWLVIFGVHLLNARFNDTLVSPNRALFHIATVGRRPLRITLQLALHLEAFHTRNRYGVCYGKIGLISMFSFLKVRER